MEKHNVVTEDRTPGFEKNAEADMFDAAADLFDVDDTVPGPEAARDKPETE